MDVPQVSIDFDAIEAEMQRRKPGQSAIVTQRKESDSVKFLSGIFEGKRPEPPSVLLLTIPTKIGDYSHIKTPIAHLMPIIRTIKIRPP